MNDPSQPILALTFVATLIGAIAAILVRSLARGSNSAGGDHANEGQFPARNPSGPPPLKPTGPPPLRGTSAPDLPVAPPSLPLAAPPSLPLAAPPSLPLGNVNTWFYRGGDLGGALALYLIFAGLFALSCVAPPVETQSIGAFALVFNMMFQLFLAAGVVGAALRLANLNEWLGWKWRQWPWVFLIAPGAVIFMLIIFWLIQLSGYMEWMESLGVETIQDTVTLLQECRDPLVLILLIFTATIIAPICEELVFRGYLYPVLKKHGGIWAAVFFSSLLFSVAHGNLAVLLPLFLLGALLVWIYEWTGSIWAPIAVHFCFNATTVIAQLVTRGMEIPSGLLPKLPF